MLKRNNIYRYRTSYSDIVSFFGTRPFRKGLHILISAIRRNIDNIQSSFYDSLDAEDDGTDCPERLSDIRDETHIPAAYPTEGYTDDILVWLNDFLKSVDPTLLISLLFDITDQSEDTDDKYDDPALPCEEEIVKVEIMDMRKKDMVCPECGNINHYDYCVYCLRPIIPAKRHRYGGHGRYSDMCRSDIIDVDHTDPVF